MVRKKGRRGRDSSSSGKSAISSDVKAEETDERKNKRCINVLVLGHSAAGKSLALHKINKLESDKVTLENATQKFKEVTMDESTQDRLLEHAMDKNEGELEGKTVTFGEIRYETKTSIFYFLEAPSDYHYVFKMMSKAMHADIAVLFVSESEDKDEIEEDEKGEQIEGCIYLISTLSIKKVLVVVNKIDNPTENQKSYNETADSLTGVLVGFGLKAGTDIKCLPLSVKTGLNFQTRMGETCTWWKGPCFVQALDEFEVVPARTSKAPTQEWNNRKSKLMVDLVRTDLAIDEKPSAGALWYKRASTLTELKKYAAAFEAAAKAGELGIFKDPDKLKTVASMMTAGHYYRMRNNFDAAIKWFNMVRDFYAQEKNTKALCIIEAFLDQAWVEWDNPRTGKFEKPKGKSSVVLRKEEDDENDNNEKDKTSSPGTQAQEEMSSSDVTINRKIKVSSVSNYEINRVDDNFEVYEGIKIDSTGGCLPLSFISGSQSQLRNFEQLLSLGLDNASILSIRDKVDITEDGVSLTFLVVQPVKTIAAFFSLELSNINNELSCSNDIISMWWNVIELKFRKIYRDVVDALVYLHSKNYPCGNLFDAKYNAVYFTSEGFVRLLPSLDTDVTFARDIHDLVKHMRAMINLPCDGRNLVLSSLNYDLSHLFTFLNPEKLKHVPSWWLLDHYIFWTPQERVNFLNNLISLTKKKYIAEFQKTLASVMTRDDVEYSWSKQIPPGIFKEIWRKGDPSRPFDASTVDLVEWRELGWFRVTAYRKHSDILRYIIVVYHHYNDEAYAPYRSEKLDDVAIEGQLKEIFPKIYMQLVDTIYSCAESGLLTHDDLKMLSRHSYTVS